VPDYKEIEERKYSKLNKLKTEPNDLKTNNEATDEEEEQKQTSPSENFINYKKYGKDDRPSLGITSNKTVEEKSEQDATPVKQHLKKLNTINEFNI
jgi:hypothetical protein